MIKAFNSRHTGDTRVMAELCMRIDIPSEGLTNVSSDFFVKHHYEKHFLSIPVGYTYYLQVQCKHNYYQVPISSLYLFYKIGSNSSNEMKT